jgi:hypothetical protein
MFAHSLHKRCKASENSLLLVYSLYDQDQKKFTHEVPIMTKKFTQSLHTLFKNVQKVYTEQTGVNRCKLRPKFAQACPPMPQPGVDLVDMAAPPRFRASSISTAALKGVLLSAIILVWNSRGCISVQIAWN